MTDVKIYGNGLTQTETNAIAKLVEEAGCPTAELEVVGSIKPAADNCDDEVFIVLLTASICANPDLEGALKAAQNGGRRVICIWPIKSEQADVPLAVEKYAYSLIPWDAERLRRALIDDDEVIFEMSDGQECPEPETDRHECA